MRNISKALLFIFVAAAIAGCSFFSSVDTKAEYPKSLEDKRRDSRGKITGEDGLLSFGKKKASEDSGSTGIGINSYLWRASLDTLSFMPLASADPFGGVIITDWYEDPNSRGERFKVNVVISSNTLSTNSLKVSVFKQTSSGGGWRDVESSKQVSLDLENKILTRARSLKVEKESSEK